MFKIDVHIIMDGTAYYLLKTFSQIHLSFITFLVFLDFLKLLTILVFVFFNLLFTNFKYILSYLFLQFFCIISLIYNFLKNSLNFLINFLISLEFFSFYSIILLHFLFIFFPIFCSLIKSINVLLYFSLLFISFKIFPLFLFIHFSYLSLTPLIPSNIFNLLKFFVHLQILFIIFGSASWFFNHYHNLKFFSL